MACPALLTRKFPNIQRHRGVDKSTITTPLAAGEESARHTDFFAIPSGLVRQHLPEHPKARTADVLGQAMVFDHASDVQIFNGDHIETANQVSGQLVHRVLASTGDVRVMASHLALHQRSPMAALDATGKNPLQLGQLRLSSHRVACIGHMLTIGQRRQSTDAQVYADFQARLRHGRLHFIQAHRHKIAPTTVLGYRNRRWFACECLRESDVETAKARHRQVLVGGIPFKTPCRVLGRLLTMLAFERRVFRTLGKEVGECRLQMAQCLLLGDARRLTQPQEANVAPVCRPCGTAGVVIDTLAILEGVSPQLQRVVIGMASTSEVPRQLTALPLSRVESGCLPYLHERIIVIFRQKSIILLSAKAALKGEVSTLGDMR